MNLVVWGLVFCYFIVDCSFVIIVLIFGYWEGRVCFMFGESVLFLERVYCNLGGEEYVD